MRFAMMFAAVLGCLAARVSPAAAEDFRIETKVYAVKDKTLISQNTTLFHDGVVYDFLQDPPEIAVFDMARGRFVLLDTERKLKFEINTTDLLEFCGTLRAKAMEGTKGVLQFSAKPQFAVEFAEKTGELTMSSEFMSYKLATTKAKTPEAARQMREFSDWYARLNALTNPGWLLPFPRLWVNQELDRRGLVATQVEVIIPPQGQLGGKTLARRSEHEVTWKLLDRDLKRISDTDMLLVSFRMGDFSEFMRAPQTAKR